MITRTAPHLNCKMLFKDSSLANVVMTCLFKSQSAEHGNQLTKVIWQIVKTCLLKSQSAEHDI